MTVEEKIKSVVEQLGITYVFENWSVANVRLDKLSFPAIINVLPASGELNFSNGNIRDCPDCMIAFIDKIPIDARGKESDDTVERMKLLAKNFFIAINSSDLFEPIGGKLTYQVVYDKLDISVTGVIFPVKLKELSGICEKVIPRPKPIFQKGNGW